MASGGSDGLALGAGPVGLAGLEEPAEVADGAPEGVELAVAEVFDEGAEEEDEGVAEFGVEVE